MEQAITLDDVMKELRGIRKEINEIKFQQMRGKELKDDFVNDLDKLEKEEGVSLDSVTELREHLESL